MTVDMGLKPQAKNIFLSEKVIPGKSSVIEPKDLKVGMVLRKGTAETSTPKKYVVTDVLGDGKFKAVEKDFYESMKGRWLDMEKDKNWMDRLSTGKETFDVSNPTQVQQYIDLTPEVKARIKGEAFLAKKPSGISPVKASELKR